MKYKYTVLIKVYYFIIKETIYIYYRLSRNFESIIYIFSMERCSMKFDIIYTFCSF